MGCGRRASPGARTPQRTLSLCLLVPGERTRTLPHKRWGKKGGRAPLSHKGAGKQSIRLPSRVANLLRGGPASTGNLRNGYSLFWRIGICFPDGSHVIMGSGGVKVKGGDDVGRVKSGVSPLFLLLGPCHSSEGTTEFFLREAASDAAERLDSRGQSGMCRTRPGPANGLKGH